jgi:hypothetical protein
VELKKTRGTNRPACFGPPKKDIGAPKQSQVGQRPKKVAGPNMSNNFVDFSHGLFAKICL